LGIFFKFGILPIGQILWIPVNWYQGTSILGEVIPSIPWISSPIRLIGNFISDLKLESLYALNGYSGPSPFFWVENIISHDPIPLDLSFHETSSESPWASQPNELVPEFLEGSSMDEGYREYFNSPDRGDQTPRPSSPVDDEWVIIEPVPDSIFSRFQNILYRHPVFFWMIGSGISYQLVMMVAPPVIGMGMNLIAQ
jgi:hypothetical protein